MRGSACKISLVEIYCEFWVKMLEVFDSLCARMLNQIGAPPTSHERVGMYNNLEDAILERVACDGYLKEFKLGSVQFSGEFMGIFSKYMVGSQYFTVTKVKSNDCIARSSMAFLGCVTRVQVVEFHVDVLRYNQYFFW